MRGTAAGLAAFGAALVLAPAAEAGVDEVHVGAMAHNICVTDCKNAYKEEGPNLELQASFDSPSFLRWAGSPQPYIMASINLGSDTSFAAIGFEWRLEMGGGWALEPGFGYAVHNGETDNPFPNGSPEAAQFAEQHLQLGSEDLFRTSIGLTYDFEGPMEAQLLFEHLSHGQVLGEGRNQGLDQIGIRIGYRFGG